MYGLLSFFHVAVHHANVTVYDADILCGRVGIFFCSFTDLDALNEQAQEFRSQFINRPEAFCLLDKGIDISTILSQYRLAVKNKETVSIAVKRFMEYLNYREPCDRNLGLCKD